MGKKKSNGEGSIVKRKDGRYMARYTVGIKLPQVSKKEILILTPVEQNTLHMAAQESHTITT